MTVTAAGSAEDLRRRLTDHLVREGVLCHPRLVEAFATVPRERFVPSFSVRTSEGQRAFRSDTPGYLEMVYSDTSLITLRDSAGVAISSSTLPRLMALMLEALPAQDDATVLEIGTGTGYNAALLCERYGDGRVVSVDVDPQLTAAAVSRLTEAGYGPTVVTGDGTLGHLARAPYAAILATCGLPRIPAAWLTQLAPGGQVVANLGAGLAVLTETDGALHGHFLAEGASFMTARRVAEENAPRQSADTTLLLGATGSTETISPPCDVTEPVPKFLAGLLHHDTVDLTFIRDDGTPVHAIQHRATGDWARLVPGDDGTAQLDHGGARNLWAERLEILAEWDQAGRPAPDRYGLTVTSDGAHTLWLDSPEGPVRPLPA